VFVGYEKGTKGYGLLDVNTNSIQVSKDVTFLERDPHSSEKQARREPGRGPGGNQ